MGMDGAEYTAGEDFVIPFYYVNDVEEAFTYYADNPEEEQRVQITGGNLSAGEKWAEDTGPVSTAVQGSGEEGNNKGELAGQPGSDDGLGDNSDAEPKTG